MSNKYPSLWTIASFIAVLLSAYCTVIAWPNWIVGIFIASAPFNMLGFLKDCYDWGISNNTYVQEGKRHE